MGVAHAEVVSVGPDEVVVAFVSEPDRIVTTRVGGHAIDTVGPFHHARVGGLAPATGYELRVEGADPTPWLPAHVRTLAAPPGEHVATVATANDVHFGEVECGKTGDPATDAIGPILRSAPGATPYPEVMNAAVVAEMRALDPDAVIVKGDLTAAGRREEYEAFLRAYGSLGPRMHHVRGNHDVMVDPDLVRERAPYAVELPGVTLAVLDTTRPGAVGGAIDGGQLDWLDALAAASDRPVLVFAHHPPWDVDQPSRTDPDFAVDRADSEALVELVARRPAVAGYFAGHTHANRLATYRASGDVPFVEVACTKDYPGTWAEYRVHEGGYVQLHRRVADPAAMAWSEQARTMIQGVYGELVLGALDARCFTRAF